MNDLFLKIIEKLGSVDNTFLFAVSIIPYAIFLFYLYKISTYKKYNLFFWLSLAMVPNLIGAMCAITWHIYDNHDALYGLVTLQGIFTFIGNSTLALAAIIIFKGKETYD